jgi:Ion transport protein
MTVTHASALSSVTMSGTNLSSRNNDSDAICDDQIEYEEDGKKKERASGTTDTSNDNEHRTPQHYDDVQQHRRFSPSSFPLPPTSSSPFTSSVRPPRRKPSYQKDGGGDDNVPEMSPKRPNSARRLRPPTAIDDSSRHQQSHHSNSSKRGGMERILLQQSSSGHRTRNVEEDEMMEQSSFAGDEQFAGNEDKMPQNANETPLIFNDVEKKEQKKDQSGTNDPGNCHGDTSEEEEAQQGPEESLLWRSRLYVGRIVNHENVQITIIMLILINAIMMGMSTMDWVTDNKKTERIFNGIDQGFLVIFTMEVSMQFYYLGFALFQDGWLIFDLSIVVLSWSFESLQVVRAFRIFRAFRLITRVKPLRDLVLAIGAVLPRMYAIAALLLIIFYVFAVLFTELFSELPLSENYFGTLDASLFTCMEMMTLEWADIAREVIEYKSWAWAPFLFFIAISGFIVYNLIVAVVVEAVAVTEQTVRALDGIEPNSPTAKLEEAEERIDLLRYHIEDMMRTQKEIQSMLEVMAGEMMNLETERMKAEEREKLLRAEINRRIEYQRNMESEGSMVSLERSFATEREKRESQRQERMMLQRRNSHELLNSMDGVSLDDLQKSMHGEEPSFPLTRSRRHARSSSKRSATSRESAAGHGSNRSLNARSVSSRSVDSSVDESGKGEKGWKRFLAFQSQDT